MWRLAAVAVLLFAAGACSSSSIEPEEGVDVIDDGTENSSQAPSDPTDPSSPPTGLLIEQRTDDPTQGPFIRRLGPAGDYWEFSREVSFGDDGTITIEPGDPEWRQREQLTSEQVTRIEDVLREHFFDLEEAYAPPGDSTFDGFQVTWTARVDDREHSVLLRSVDAGEIPGLAEVRDAFEFALAEAAAAAGARERGE